MNGQQVHWARRVAPPIVVLIGVAGALEAYLRVAHVKAYTMPAPSLVALAFIDKGSTLFPALGWTALEALGGFFASLLIGVGLAIVLSTSSLVRRALYPYTIFFQTVPIVAIAPLLLDVLGSGVIPVAVCAFIVSVFPVIANTLAGLMSTDPALVDLFRLYGATPVSSFWKLRLPSALPYIFTGLRVAGGLAVIGTVVAEFLVGQIVGQVGLGVLIVEAIHNSHLDVAFAAILLASFLGLAIVAAVNLAGWMSLRRWHVSEQ